jgi:hypothetical protein
MPSSRRLWVLLKESMNRSWFSTLLSLVGGLYVVFALSVCWRAYAKAQVPLSVATVNGQQAAAPASPQP